jgi:hypothetical protein
LTKHAMQYFTAGQRVEFATGVVIGGSLMA